MNDLLIICSKNLSDNVKNVLQCSRKYSSFLVDPKFSSDRVRLSTSGLRIIVFIEFLLFFARDF